MIYQFLLEKNFLYKIKLEDKFFDSLRDDYNDFNFVGFKKQEAGAKAYITRNEK